MSPIIDGVDSTPSPPMCLTTSLSSTTVSISAVSPGVSSLAMVRFLLSFSAGEESRVSRPHHCSGRNRAYCQARNRRCAILLTTEQVTLQDLLGPATAAASAFDRARCEARECEQTLQRELVSIERKWGWE